MKSFRVFIVTKAQRVLREQFSPNLRNVVVENVENFGETAVLSRFFEGYPTKTPIFEEIVNAGDG